MEEPNWMLLLHVVSLRAFEKESDFHSSLLLTLRVS